MQNDRMVWIDAAKGIGIILVVIGHAGRGIMSAAIPDEQRIIPMLDVAIYAFHMPLFFILSGVTIGMRPVSTIQPDLTRKIWRIFYPLVLWTYLFLAMQAVAGAYANSNVSWEDLLTLPLPPVAHFWFLWALLLNVASFAIARLLFRSLASDVWFWVFAICISAAANSVPFLSSALVPWFGAALRFSVAFAIGGLIGASKIGEAVPSRQTAIVAALLFAFGLWGAIQLKTAAWDIIIGSMLSLLLLLPLAWVAAKFGQWSAARAVAFLGTISLAIYVMHTPFSAAVRIALGAFGINNLSIHLVLGVLVGVLGPLITYLAARRFHVLRAVGLA
jgi:fucose 4-O-acetylase-like acetyltransferase